MVVHSDEAGDDGVSAEVEGLRILRNGDVGADALNLSAGDEEGLIVARGRTGAVDDLDVSERDDRSIGANELLEFGRKLSGRESGGEAEEKCEQAS